MTPFFRSISSRCFAVLAALLLALAQGGAQAQPAYASSQPELEQILAPIALYPDALLSQILTAATYPADVVEAARWSREHADLAGEAAVLAAQAEVWDPSVKSLLAFPQMLEYMRANLQWTQALGGAVMTQQAQVMDTLQDLRRRAQAAGNLRSDDHLNVVESGPDLLLQPATTQAVYVPYYDPQLAYGPWPWAGYPPVTLPLWPVQYLRPAYTGIFRWGPPLGIATARFVGAIDWHRRDVKAVRINSYPATQHRANDTRDAGINRAPPSRPDPSRGKGAVYGAADTYQRAGATAAPMRAIAPPAPAGTPVHPIDNNRLEHRTEFRAPIAATPPPARLGGNLVPVPRAPPDPRLARATEAQIRAQAPAQQQGPRFDPGASAHLPRMLEARTVVRPAADPPPPRPASMAVVRQEPAAHVQAPPASMPRQVAQAPARAPRQEPAEKMATRSGMRP